MTDPFKSYKEKIAEQNCSRFRYPLRPLGELAEIKRRAAAKYLRDEKEQALVIEKSAPAEYGLLAFPIRETTAEMTNSFVAYKNELCFFEASPAGSIICEEDLCITGRGYFVIAPKGELLVEYLLVLFKSGHWDDQFYALRRGRGLSLGIKEIRGMPVPVPPLAVQELIRAEWQYEASKAKERWQMIGELEKTIGRLEEKIDMPAPEPIKVEFGNFSEETLAHANCWSYDYLASLTGAAGGEKRQSPSRFLPLAEVAEIYVGKSIPAGLRSDEGIPLYSSGNLLYGYLSSPPLAYVKENYLGGAISKKAVAEDGDILLCVLGADTLGKAAVFSGSCAVINNSLARVKIKKKYDTPANRLLLAVYFNTRLFHKKLASLGRGDKNKYVKTDDLLMLKVPDIGFTGDAEICGILSRYESLAKKISAIDKELARDDHTASKLIKKFLS